MEWLRDVQGLFREPAMALLAQYWWVLALAVLVFWLIFVLEIEPRRGQRDVGELVGDEDGASDSGGGDGD